MPAIFCVPIVLLSGLVVLFCEDPFRSDAQEVEQCCLLKMVLFE